MKMESKGEFPMTYFFKIYSEANASEYHINLEGIVCVVKYFNVSTKKCRMLQFLFSKS